MKHLAHLVCLLALVLCGAPANAAELRMAVTTSFHNSGLADILLPRIKADLDLDVRLLVVGTGQALRLGRAGDVDAVLVHSRQAEEDFVAAGYATHRREIMVNDFVLVGPAADPAGIASATSAAAALTAIARAQAPFVSRGDDSGTHRKELSLWKVAGIDVGNPSGTWYRAGGSGMATTLNVASGMNAYVLSDRASWLKFNNKGDLKLLYSGDPALLNQYAYLPINPAKHPHVKFDLADKLESWLAGPEGQTLIAGYTLGGEKLFIPNATQK